MNEQCIFSGLPREPITDQYDAISYTVEVNKHKYLIRIQWDTYTEWPKDTFFKEHKNIFNSLLFHNKWFETNDFVITIDSLKELISDSDFPSTPKEKLDALFLKLFSLQKEDGQLIEFDENYYRNILWIELYFKSRDELNYYAKNLVNGGLIDGTYGHTHRDVEDLINFNVTYNGLNYAIQLRESGPNSNLCFIAMAFKKETEPARKAIKRSLSKTGYKAIIIDEENIDSDKTINDAIIANLKKCYFCISDFSFHSNGVYFESGFALGQGKKVIYTCSREEFKNAHFDIRPLQHIIYDSPEQLEKDLIDKIEAWVL